MQKVRRLNPERRWSELSVVLMDHVGITPVNAAYLDHLRTTDVISFAYAPLPTDGGWTGEVIVNVEQAIEQGQRRGDIAKEFALYLAHGCDHLSGADDKTDPERRKMRRRELRWLQELDYSGIIQIN